MQGERYKLEIFKYSLAVQNRTSDSLDFHLSCQLSSCLGPPTIPFSCDWGAQQALLTLWNSSVVMNAWAFLPLTLYHYCPDAAVIVLAFFNEVPGTE